MVSDAVLPDVKLVGSVLVTESGMPVAVWQAAGYPKSMQELLTPTIVAVRLLMLKSPEPAPEMEVMLIAVALAVPGAIAKAANASTVKDNPLKIALLMLIFPSSLSYLSKATIISLAIVIVPRVNSSGFGSRKIVVRYQYRRVRYQYRAV